MVQAPKKRPMIFLAFVISSWSPKLDIPRQDSTIYKELLDEDTHLRDMSAMLIHSNLENDSMSVINDF